MTDRMSMDNFLEQCNGVVDGYSLRPDQIHPETYDELVAFIRDRLDITEECLSVSGLSEWLLNNRVNPESCSPEMDVRHVEATILIGELPDPDGYVGSLPNPPGGIVVPPPQLVRQLLADQAR